MASLRQLMARLVGTQRKAVQVQAINRVGSCAGHALRLANTARNMACCARVKRVCRLGMAADWAKSSGSDYPESKWCREEDSNLHGSYPTNT